MNCLYCGKKIDKYAFTSLFIQTDYLCIECRNKLKIDRKYIYIDKMKIETFYDYDGIFKNLLIQYKECYDEALYPIFLYKLNDYIKYKYYGYKLILMPSSKKKLDERGFNHLKLIFEQVNMAMVDGLKMKEDLIQEGKGLNQRRLMIDNYVYDGEKIDKVLLVDDVLTSGSSMLGAYKALKNSCKNIRGICLARKK